MGPERPVKRSGRSSPLSRGGVQGLGSCDLEMHSLGLALRWETRARQDVADLFVVTQFVQSEDLQ